MRNKKAHKNTQSKDDLYNALLKIIQDLGFDIVEVTANQNKVVKENRGYKNNTAKDIKKEDQL